MSEKEQRIAQHKRELTNYVSSFYQTSWNWRQQSYHTKWDNYERNFRNIYNPLIKAKKKEWQSTMFVPATVSNVEVITASLTKIASTQKRPFGLEPREMGDELQADLNNSLLDFYVEKGDYVFNRYKVLKEAAIFGSGFMKLIWERKYAKRNVAYPQREGFVEALKKGRIQRQVTGTKVKLEDILVKNGIRYQYVHIRDIFLEPNSTDMAKVIHRDKIPYSDMKHLADDGFFDKDSVEELWDVEESPTFEQDIAVVKYSQQIVEGGKPTPQPAFDKKHTVWEFNGLLPKKWVYLETSDDDKDAEELIFARAIVASGKWFLGVEENSSYSSEPPFLKMDYLWNGQTYGIGVAQLMEGLQDELNEMRNLRVDNVALSLNKIFAVIEKSIVNVNDVRSEPGAVIRLKSNIDDVRKGFAEVPVSDVAISSFRETLEIERQIQETTAANRVTIGTAGLQRDQNQTLGGMELLRQSAMDRFVVYAYLIGRQFDVNVARKSMELIYSNIDEKSVFMILGQIPIEDLMHPDVYVPRYKLWKRILPDELAVCYDFVAVDVFNMENKGQKSQDLIAKLQLVASIVPQFNPKKAIEKLFKLSDFSTEEIQEILSGLPQEGQSMPSPMMFGKGVPSISAPGRGTMPQSAPPKQSGPPMPVPGGMNGA